MKREKRSRILSLFWLPMLVLLAWAGAAEQAPTDAASPCESGIGHPNPADVYCLELGYRLDTVKADDGLQYAACIFPDGNACDAWQFLEGKCGEPYSYCAQNGFDQIVKTDGKNPFSPHYAVCVVGKAEVGSVTALMGLSQRYERAPGELRSQWKPAPPRDQARAPAELPASFDWRDHNGQNWMTAVHDQAACGSCWAFSAVGTVEAVYNIATNFPDLDLDLSEEFLNSDCPAPDPGSCCGGWHDRALGIIRDDGIPDEDCMAYDEAYYRTGDCSCFPTGICTAACQGLPTNCSNLICADRCADWASRLVTIDDYYSVPEDQDEIKQRLVDEGPLAVCLAMRGEYDAQGVYRCTTCWDRNDNDTCQTSGTCNNVTGRCAGGGLNGWDCDSDDDCDEDRNGDGVCDQDDCGTNHCVVLVGYDDAGGYWIAKNSYGPTYGPDRNGYWQVGYGECHIEESVYYVEPDDLNFPPIADANGPYNEACQGTTTQVSLDGTGSQDPNADDTLTYAWTTACPAGTFDDASSATPLLTVDSSPGCLVQCDVSLTVTDDDGASDTATASVEISDAAAPAITCPANVTVECDESTDPADTGTATATDDCDPAPAITYADVEMPGACPDEETISRTWTATDACGHTSTCQQTIHVVDTTAPVLSVPADVTIECDESTDPSNTGTGTATDNCDAAPAVTYADLTAPGACPEAETISRTWTATDACGNATSGVQTINVVDTTAPVISCNAPATIIPPDAPISFTATAPDNCDGGPTVTITAYDCFKFTNKGKEIDKKESCVVGFVGDSVTIYDSGGVGTYITWNVHAIDSCGNVAEAECQVEVIRKGGH
jgi:putative hemolysin/C1A family cysteine protease